MISNHFLYKDLVHHPIDSQPFINRWPSGSRHGIPFQDPGVFGILNFRQFRDEKLLGGELFVADKGRTRIQKLAALNNPGWSMIAPKCPNLWSKTGFYSHLSWI